MANAPNTTNITLSEDTYNRLKILKEKHNLTFTEMVDWLCELEFQHNYVSRVQDYELVYQDKIFQFRITFKKNNIVFEYFTENSITTKINEWGLPNRLTSQFIEFINEGCSRCIFENMPIGLIFKEFDIYKL